MARNETRRSTETQVFGVEPSPPPSNSSRLEAVEASDGAACPPVAPLAAASGRAPGLPTRRGDPSRGRARADGLPVEGELVGGLYRLVRLIGEGMFGRVYVAERTD